MPPCSLLVQRQKASHDENELRARHVPARREVYMLSSSGLQAARKRLTGWSCALTPG